MSHEIQRDIKCFNQPVKGYIKSLKYRIGLGKPRILPFTGYVTNSVSLNASYAFGARLV